MVILLEAELFLLLLLLIFLDKVKFDGDFGGDDILEGIAALGHAFLFTGDLYYSHFIITAELTVLLFLHAVSQKGHGVSL